MTIDNTAELVERLRSQGGCAPSCADGSICYEWNGEAMIDAADLIESQASELAALRLEAERMNMAYELQGATAAALRLEVERLGGGCDANGGGLHSMMMSGKEPFCPDCGLMLKRVAYVLPHVKPSEARAALSTQSNEGGE